ncbi:MAG: hypothetical protein KC420_13840 [Myxococcales bacterium]|nr:hypothetical protein [Myxococcales bacterium]
MGAAIVVALGYWVSTREAVEGRAPERPAEAPSTASRPAARPSRVGDGRSFIDSPAPPEHARGAPGDRRQPEHVDANDEGEGEVEGEDEDEASREARRCAGRISSDEECPFLQPSPEVLREMARCAQVRTDVPPGLLGDQPFHVDPELRSLAQVTEAEERAIAEVGTRVRGELRAEIEPLFVELGLAGEPDAMSVEAMVEAIQARRVVGPIDEERLARLAEGEAARRAIARARAGLDPGESPSTPTARLEFLLAELGDRYERALASELGAERAGELRAAADGWGQRGVAGGRCEDE